MSPAAQHLGRRPHPPSAAQLAAALKRTTPPSPDKTAIKAAIKAGRDVAGCRLTQGQRLEIK